MTIAVDWHVRATLDIGLKIIQGDTGSENIAPPTAKRTNAKFLIACGIQLITFIVMVTRALINIILVSLSACTAHCNKCSNSAQSKRVHNYVLS